MNTITHARAMAALLLVAAAPALVAQPSGYAFSTFTRSTTATTTMSGFTLEHRGRIYATEGLLKWGRMGVRMTYGQGSLDPSAPPSGLLGESDGSPVDYVEGSAAVAVPVATGLDLSVGVMARSFISDTAGQRWLYWPIRARYEAPVMGPAIGAFVELWRAVGGAAPGALTFEHAAGGSVGLLAHPMDGRLLIRLSYDVDESRLEAGARRETVQGLSIGLGMVTGSLRPHRS